MKNKKKIFIQWNNLDDYYIDYLKEESEKRRGWNLLKMIPS